MKKRMLKIITAILTLALCITGTTPVIAAEQTTDNTLPSSYDAREYGYITSKKNQFPYGTCWAFAATAAAEASLIKSGLADSTIDLSEYHTAYYTYMAYDDPLGNTKGDTSPNANLDIATVLYFGGHPSEAGDLFAKWCGPVSETAMPYEEAKNKLLPSVDFEKETKFHLTKRIGCSSTDRDAIKELIMDYGSVTADYWVGKEIYVNYKDYNEVTYHIPNTTTSNHSVSLIGWDDTYPKENFNVQPKNDGAWLVKNHDGSNQKWMYISYETNIQNITAFEFEPAELLENNYQYDALSTEDTTFTSVVSTSSMKLQTAMNVFEAKCSKNTLEKLEAVMINGSHVSERQITIYVNPVIKDGQMISYEYKTAPMSFCPEYSGVYKVDLLDTIYLNSGDTFGIEVTCGSTGSYLISNENVNPGESYAGYITQNNSVLAYTDLADYSNSGNFQIKGFTNSTDIPLAGDVTIDRTTATLEAGESFTIHGEVDVPNGAIAGISYASSDPDVVTVDEDGNVTAIAPGTATITVRATYGSGIAECNVTVDDTLATTLSVKKNVSLYQNGTLQLDADVDDKATDKRVSYESSDESIVTVDEDGMLHGIFPGTATITVRTMDGSNLSAVCTVTVVSPYEGSLTPGTSPTPTPEPDPEPPLKQDKDNNSNVNDKRNDSNKDTGNNKTDSEDVKVGDTFTSGSLKYDITSLGKRSSSGTVRVTGVKSKNSKSITVPATVKYKDKTYKVDFIGTKAFYGCRKLQSVSIGKNVTGIASKAFYNCKKLKTINVTSKKISSVGKNAFKGIKSNAKIAVPKSKYKTYKKSFKKAGVGSKVAWKKK